MRVIDARYLGEALSYKMCFVMINRVIRMEFSEKIQLEPTTFIFLGQGTSSEVSLAHKVTISSSISINH